MPVVLVNPKSFAGCCARRHAHSHLSSLPCSLHTNQIRQPISPSHLLGSNLQRARHEPLRRPRVGAHAMDASYRGPERQGPHPRTFVLGLTGSIGMGKSTVSSMFRDEGVPVWDADATVHQLYGRGGAAVPLVEAAFPGVIADGAVDRAALSSRVVGNEAAMKQLEGIVHPLVAQSRLEFLKEVQRQGRPLAVLDIPLLFETGGPGPRRHGTDAVAVVSASPELQRQRVLSRPGMGEEKLAAILARQVPDSEKRRLADYVIDTSTDLETTRVRVSELVRELSAGGQQAGTLQWQQPLQQQG